MEATPLQTKTKAILVAILFTLLGFLLNPNAPLGGRVWGEPPAAPEGAGPTGAQVGLLMLVGLVESVAFGLGAALLLLGLPLARRLEAAGVPARSAWVAIVWALMSWVPHTAMHMTNGANMARLVAIEYAFHVTLVVAAVVLARFFVRLAQVPRGALLAAAEPRPAGA